MVTNNRLIARERRQRVFDAITESGIASVRDLAQRFGVSEITIARDLVQLEGEGLVRRVHGGAVSVRAGSYEPPFKARESQLHEEKRRIAARAVELVQDGDSVLLDVGTTALEVARALKGRRNLTVILSNLWGALELADHPSVQVIVVGGKLRAGELSMVGHLAENTLRSFQVDRAFIGVGGISLEHGITEFSYEEAGTKRIMLEQSRQRIVVADHTKFGKVMLAAVAPLTAVETLVTGAEADVEMVARLRQLGVEVILA